MAFTFSILNTTHDILKKACEEALVGWRGKRSKFRNCPDKELVYTLSTFIDGSGKPKIQASVTVQNDRRPRLSPVVVRITLGYEDLEELITVKAIDPMSRSSMSEIKRRLNPPPGPPPGARMLNDVMLRRRDSGPTVLTSDQMFKFSKLCSTLAGWKPGCPTMVPVTPEEMEEARLAMSKLFMEVDVYNRGIAEGRRLQQKETPQPRQDLTFHSPYGHKRCCG